MKNKSNTEKSSETSFSFESLQTDLNKAGHNTYIMPVNDDNAVEQLLVSTHENTAGESNPDSPVVQIMFVNDLLTASNMANAINDTDIMQFFVSIPFQIDNKDLTPAKFLEMHQLLSVFSRVVPVGAFGISDDGGAFFRYSLMSINRNLENKLVVELIKVMSFFINKFSIHLSSFAQGNKSLDEILKETEKELSQVG